MYEVWSMHEVWLVVAGTVASSALLAAPSFLPRGYAETALRAALVAFVVVPIVFGLYGALDWNFGGAGRALEWSGTPHWNRLGEAANHDFCEANHVRSPYVAEWHNTWSSVPMLYFGAAGSWATRRWATKELRFTYAFFTVSAVGMGSVYFHGTLRRWGQILDEAPMMLLTFYGIFVGIERERKQKYGIGLPVAIFLSWVATVLGYLVYNLYMLFLASFVIGVAGSVSTVLLMSRPGVGRFVGAIGVGSLLFGFGLWLMDNLLCKNVALPTQWMNLHVLWHFFSGFGAYMLVLMYACVRADALDKRPVLVVGLRRGWQVDDVYGRLRWRKGPRPQLGLPYIAYRAKLE